MPEQFIKVKHSDIQPVTIFSDAIKKPESGGGGGIYGSSSNISNSNGDICRICHCEADFENPLLSPCYCAGSLKYVHQACLQQWLAASDTRSCELCKFHFILHTKIKPISEWRRLEMSSIERRRLLCAILFHFVAAVCVVWSLFVLIDRAAEEVHRGLIAWPFWTKLVVVAVGFTGGAVFMYIQCRQYLHLFSRWKAHNRIILVQNAPEKISAAKPASPSFKISINPVNLDELSSQVVAECNIECPPQYSENKQPPPHESCYVFDEDEVTYKHTAGGLLHYQDQLEQAADATGHTLATSHGGDPLTDPEHFNKGLGVGGGGGLINSTSDNIGLKSENSAQQEAGGVASGATPPADATSVASGVAEGGGNASCGGDALELNIQEILALDMEYSKRRCTRSGGGGAWAGSTSNEQPRIKPKTVFKSLPNLSASSENLLL